MLKLILYYLIHIIQKLVVVNPNVEIVATLFQCLRSKITENIKRNIVIMVNGGGFIFDDMFDLNYKKVISIKYPNCSIVNLEYPKNRNFDYIYSEFKKNWKKLSHYNVVCIFAHSAGAGLVLRLSKDYKLRKVILFSPFINWNNNYQDNVKDILNIDVLNKIIYMFNYKTKCNVKNIQNLRIVSGSDEIMLPDVKDFCYENNVTDFTILKNKPHGLMMWRFDHDFSLEKFIV